MTITRYALDDYGRSPNWRADMAEHAKGEYVTYDDHMAALAAMPRLSAGAKETLRRALESSYLDALHGGACPPSPQAGQRIERIRAARAEIDALPIPPITTDNKEAP